MQDIHRTLGEHGADISTLKTDVSLMKIDLREVLELLNQAKGGWKGIALIAGMSSALTTFLIKVSPVLAAIVK